MSQVLYRKWRPQRLDQVVGQEAITQTLRNAVTQGRTAHAYLFCGPRGTGKTSTARILAKAVNCLSPVDGEPDNECVVCESINESRALDLIEIDAASNRGIDDIRNLRDKIHFTPNEARYKVYIVDEVHMLTEAAFNALLKTLEEPPAHAIFVLATTEAHKVPLTIISRCQRFDFRRIPMETVVARLAQLCKDEGIEAEEEALTLLARSAGGSLRDAENLLERAIVSYGTPLSEAQMRDLLEMDSDERALDLVEHVVRKAVPEGLTVIGEVSAQGSDLRQFHRAATDYLRGVMLAKAKAESGMTHPPEVMGRLRSLAEEASLEHLVRALKLFVEADSRRDSLSPLSIEMALVQSSLEPQAVAAPRSHPGAPAETAAPARPAAPTRSPAPARPTATPPRRAEAVQEPQAAQYTPARPPARPARPVPPEELPDDPAQRLEVQWPWILRSLNRQKGRRFNVGALLRSSTERTVDDGVIRLRYSHSSHMDRMQGELEDPETRKVIKDTLATAMGGPYDIEVEGSGGGGNAPAKSPSQRSHLVRALQGMGARVVGETEDEREQEHVAPGAEAPKADDEGAGGA